MRYAGFLLVCLFLAGCGGSPPPGISAAERAACEKLVSRMYEEINRTNAELELLDRQVAAEIDPPPGVLTVSFGSQAEIEAAAERRHAELQQQQVDLIERRAKVAETLAAVRELEKALQQNSPPALEAARKKL